MIKRLLSLAVAITILITSTCLTSFALSNESTEEKENKYKHFLTDAEHYLSYDEVYYHYIDENVPESDIDWAIINCEYFAGSPCAVASIVLERVIISENLYVYYPVGWAIYDAQLNKIISIDEIDVTKYDGLEKGMEKAKVGYPFGDADYDRVLTIEDATYIQCALVGLCKFNKYDLIQGMLGLDHYDESYVYISDIDHDGKRTIMDATAIQMKLAKK